MDEACVILNLDIFLQNDTQEKDCVDMGSLEISDVAVVHGLEKCHGTKEYISSILQVLSYLLVGCLSKDEIVEAARGTIPVCRVLLYILLQWPNQQDI